MEGPEQQAVGTSSPLADDPGQMVLDMLEFVEVNNIAVIESGSDDTACHHFREVFGQHITRDEGKNITDVSRGNVSQMAIEPQV